MTLTVGTKAPLFVLKTKTADGLTTLSLGDVLGPKPIVLLFFPFAFTSVCTDELCGVSQNFSRYEELGALVYGISIDSPFALEAWAQQNAIRITLLSDFNKEVARTYGVLYPDLVGFQGVAKRSAFVIDRHGYIAYASSSDDPKVLPDFQAIQSTLAALR